MMKRSQKEKSCFAIAYEMAKQSHSRRRSSANGMDRLLPPPRKLRRHRQGGAAP